MHPIRGILQPDPAVTPTASLAGVDVAAGAAAAPSDAQTCRERGRSRAPKVLAPLVAPPNVHFDADAPAGSSQGGRAMKRRPAQQASGATMVSDWHALRERVDAQLTALDHVCEQVSEEGQRQALLAARARVNFAEIDAFVDNCARQVETAQKLSRQGKKLFRGIAADTASLRQQLQLPPPGTYNTSSIGSMAAEVRSFVVELSLGHGDVPPLTPDAGTSDEEWVCVTGAMHRSSGAARAAQDPPTP